MANTMAPSVVQTFRPSARNERQKQIADGNVIAFVGADGEAAFYIKFKTGVITITKNPDGEPCLARVINQKYGNQRQIESQLHEVADMALEYLFGIKEGT